MLVINQDRLEARALLREDTVELRDLLVLRLQELVRLLELLDLEHADLVAGALFNLGPHAVDHELHHLFAEAQIALEHALFSQVLRLQVTDQNFELGTCQVELLVLVFFFIIILTILLRRRLCRDSDNRIDRLVQLR